MMEGMVQDKVSIIIPMYNAELFIERCIDSLKKQTYKNFEVILVNDGSTDGSLLVCEKLTADDDRFKVIHQENQGPSVARNTGIASSDGQFLCFVDADDCVDQEYIAHLAAILKENDADIAMCGFQYFYNDLPASCLTKQKAEITEILGHDILLTMHRSKDEPYVVVWGKLYRRALFEGIEFPPGRVWEDYYVLYHLFDRAKKLVISDRTLYFYFRNNQNSSTFRLSSQFFEDMRFVLKKELNYMQARNYEDIVILIQKRYMYWLIYEYGTMSLNADRKRALIQEYRELFRASARHTPERMYRFFYFAPALYKRLKY